MFNIVLTNLGPSWKSCFSGCNHRCCQVWRS